MNKFLLMLGLFLLLNGALSYAQEESGENTSPDWDVDSIFDEPSDALAQDEAEPSAEPSEGQGELDINSILGFDKTSDWVSTLDWDINAVFDEPFLDSSSGSTGESASGTKITSLLRRRGIIFDGKYEFIAGIAPGWTEPPWFKDDDTEFSWGQSAKLRADFGLTAQISEVFRVKTVVYFKIPTFKFTLGDFFFDYNILDRVFVKGGKYEQSWGLSSNFDFTNLLTRVPKNASVNDSFILKFDVPIGIGGIQVLAHTRFDLMTAKADKLPGWLNIGYGAKYNLAFRWADFDLGVFYHDDMPFRGFLSIKTTIWETELYNEWLGVNIDKPKEFSGAFNVGFYRDFFGGDLSVNGELFYNAEGSAFFYQSETSISDAKLSPFIEGLNFALNVVYRLGGKMNPRFFIQSKYAPEEESARLIPGIRLNLLPNLELYFAVPMALGSRTGYYYNNPLATLDPKKKPFCIVMLLTLKGSVRAGYYY